MTQRTVPSPAKRRPSAARAALALLNGKESVALLMGAFFIAAELVFVGMAHLSTLPFFLCAGGFSALLLVAATHPQSLGFFRQKSDGKTEARFLALLLMTKFLAVVTAATGGPNSPFAATLFLPVFIGALYFGIAGSVATSVSVVVLFWFLRGWNAAEFPVGQSVPLRSGVFLAVSLFAGLLVRRLEQTAQTAQIRAKQQSDKAARFEWLNDTSVMMESLMDLEQMLAVGLLRVDELVPASTIAVFLREPEGPNFLLAQTLGISDEAVGLHRVALADQKSVQEAEFSALFWPDIRDAKARDEAGIWTQMDAKARSMVVVPLRTYDDVFGVLYVARHGEKAFTPTERDNLMQMARHIVYPIQRVRLQALATTDPLTGLSNRRAFRRRLQTEVERATRYRHSLSLIMFDIDHFKTANDTLGHRAGDALLTQIGGILHHACRGIDMAARYGGEELVIICPETGEVEAVRVAERVRLAVAEHIFVLPDGGDTRLTISAGVAALPLHAHDAPTLVEAADAALYDAKQSGRNRVCSAQDAQNARKSPPKNGTGTGVLQNQNS